MRSEQFKICQAGVCVSNYTRHHFPLSSETYADLFRCFCMVKMLGSGNFCHLLSRSAVEFLDQPHFQLLCRNSVMKRLIDICLCA